MPANCSGMRVGWMCGRFPGRIGHLFSPGGWRGPWEFAPYALDNGRFPCWSKGTEWSATKYRELLSRAQDSGQPPLWALVPDVVGDRDATLREWDTWAPELASYGWPLAFAAQDGMTPDDVPSEADVVFVGGSTEWKWLSIHGWCESFPRVHVGRVNGEKGLWICHEAGVESCDGTGWFRGDRRQEAGLTRYLERSSRGLGPLQQPLFSHPDRSSTWNQLLVSTPPEDL